MPRNDPDAPLSPSRLRKTGIDPIGDTPWGTHFCHFYETKEDLADLLVPYFKAGLENNEFCMWVTSEPFAVADAKKALRKAMPRLDDYIKKQQIEILDYSEWYTSGGGFDADRVLEGWVEKEQWAVERGFDGLRLTGNTFWLGDRDWKSFADYEAAVNNVIGQHRMIALCSYALQRCGPHEFMDVVHNHQFALVKREGEWQLIASSGLQLARQALLEERTRYQTLFEQAPDGIVIIDPESKEVVEFNGAAHRQLGYSREEFAGLRLLDIEAAEAPKEIDAHVQQVLRQGRDDFETRHRAKNGEIRDVLITVQAVKLSGRLLFHCIFRDITERKRAEEALSEQRLLMETVLDQAADAIMVCGVEGELLFVNAAARSMTGQSPGGPIDAARWGTLCDPDGRPVGPGDLALARALRGDVIIALERHVVRPDGRSYDVLASAAPVRNAKGEIVAAVSTVTDITDRKQAEEALQNLATLPGENPNPVMRVAADGTVIYANESSRPLLELWGCGAGATLPAQPYQWVESALAVGGPTTAETACGDRTFLIICAPVAGRDYVNIYGVEITIRKRAEEALREARAYAESIVETVREPLVILDADLRVISANQAFYRTFQVSPEGTENQLLYHLGNRQWDIPRLRQLLDEILPRNTSFLNFEVDHDFEGIGRRTMLLNARRIHGEAGRTRMILLAIEDITERKRAEEAVLTSETRFRRLFEAAKDGILILDADTGRVVEANPFMESMLGYSREEIVGRKLWEIGPFAHAAASEEAFSELRRQGYIRYEDLPLQTKDGRRVEVEFVSNVYEVDHGKVIQCNVRDISERKQAEDALRQTRDYLEKLIDYANAPIIVWDPSFTITRFNGAFERLTGRPATEVVGQRLEVLFPEQERAASMEKIDRTVQGEHWELIEIPILHQSGEVRQVLWNSANITDGDGRTVVATIAQGTDITERKQAEEALRESRADLARAQAVAHIGSWRLDVQRDELSWSDETHRMFGVPQGTPMTYEAFLAAVHPDDREYVDREWAAAQRGEPYDIEHRIVVGDAVRWVREQAEMEFDEDGTLLGGFGTVQDITERKVAEEALERLRTEFMGMVTHELKTPLTAIKGSAATALGSRTSLSVEESRELFEIIDEQSDRMRELMDNLLDATRIEAGALSVSPEPTDLREVLEEARATFARGGGQQQVYLEVPDEMPRVHADRRRLFQVLANLLNNAGGFSAPTDPITIAVEHDAVQATVHVKDCGRGIPKEKLPFLFKKFSRLHDDAGSRLSGTGLGLAICKGIVEAHGGRIWAESAGDCEGSTFSFTLPVASEVSVKAASDEARRAAHVGKVRRPTEKTRVLAVDDEPQILRFLRRSLDEAGYQTIVTTDPREVAKLVELEEPDLVLLDLALPGTSGFELLERIREFSGVPVIFLTASDKEEDTVRALKAGADDYITKPFSPSELLARIGATLRRRVLPDVMEARPPFALADLLIDFTERRVTVGGQDISLSATEYKILHLLATNAGRPVTYEQILHEVWGPEYAQETELVRSFIRNLRRKLGDDAQNPRFILTERQVGYRMPKP